MAYLESVREDMSHQVLPLDRCPPVAIRAFRLAGQRTRIHMSLDCIFMDHWGIQILFRELIQLYKNPADPLQPGHLELSYRDYVMATLALPTTAAYQQSLGYWQQRLSTLPPAPLQASQAMRRSSSSLGVGCRCETTFQSASFSPVVSRS